MAAVGRKRSDGNPLELEPRVYWKNGQWQYRHRSGGWEKLGTDVTRANERARALNNPSGYGTLVYWIERFLIEAAAGRLPAGQTLSARTIADYQVELGFIRLSPLAQMDPLEVAREPNVLGTYRDCRVTEDGKGQVQANHSLALLSSTFAWLLEKGHCRGLTINPVKMIKRFSRRPKDRYVEDHEYRPVYAIAQRSICMGLELVYRTLQRPADVLGLAPSALRTKAVAGLQKRVLTVTQGKTGRTVDIEVTPELEEALHMLAIDGQLGSMPLSADGKVRRPLATLVHTTAGEAYTEDGFGSMLRRYCTVAGVRSFGLMDVRAKGATDMYLRGVPLEHIQLLMGHASVQTTEIYIKRLLATVRIVRPNEGILSASR